MLQRLQTTSARGGAHHPLIELTLARLREFVREPEALFWSFFFPIVMSVAMAIAFPSQGSQPVRVGVPQGAASVYTRALFTIPEADGVNQLKIAADWDDGWAAWINGVEVYRSPEMPVGGPAWNADPALHESSNGTPPIYAPVVDVSVAVVDTTTTLNVPATAKTGAAVDLTATVSPAEATGTVEFKDGATVLGTAPVTGGTATLNHTFTADGAHSITAVYSGAEGFATSTSAPGTVDVSTDPVVVDTTTTLGVPATAVTGTAKPRKLAPAAKGRLAKICSPGSAQSPSALKSTQASSNPPGADAVTVSVAKPPTNIGLVKTTPSSSSGKAPFTSSAAAAMFCKVPLSPSMFAPIFPEAWKRKLIHWVPLASGLERLTNCLP